MARIRIFFGGHDQYETEMRLDPESGALERQIKSRFSDIPPWWERVNIDETNRPACDEIIAVLKRYAGGTN